MFPKRVYCSPCLMTFIDEMKNLMINDLDGILIFLKEIEKNEVFLKVFCIKLINQTDLMILCENYLNVSILASSKYYCSADEGGVCVRNCWSKMTEFYFFNL